MTSFFSNFEKKVIFLVILIIDKPIDRSSMFLPYDTLKKSIIKTLRLAVYFSSNLRLLLGIILLIASLLPNSRQTICQEPLPILYSRVPLLSPVTYGPSQHFNAKLNVSKPRPRVAQRGSFTPFALRIRMQQLWVNYNLIPILDC